MNNQTKLEFRLVPTKGVASGKGFRAEWTSRKRLGKATGFCVSPEGLTDRVPTL